MGNMKKQRIHTIIQVGNLQDIPSRTYDIVLMAAILINLVIAILETFPELAAGHTVFKAIEYVTLVFFAVDYVLRVWSAKCLYPTLSEARARLKYMVSWSGIVDLLSCIPLFIPMGAGVLRMFRIIRILRIFRVHHYADPMHVISEVLNKKKGQLLSSCFIVLILMITSSLLMYTLEHEAQPEAFANAFSGFWWAVNTLLTVGYGDIVPITLAGKMCGTVLTFLGVGMVAIPTGILSAGFMEQVNELKLKQEAAQQTKIITEIEGLSGASAGCAKEGAAACITNGAEEEYSYCPYCGHKL